MLMIGFCMLLLCAWGSILALPVFALFMAGVFFLGEIPLASSTAAVVVLGLALVSIPATAMLAGALADAFSLQVRGGRIFSPLALVLSSFLLLQSDGWYEMLDAAAAAKQASGLHYAQAALSLLSNMILVAGLAAFILILVPLLLEIPVHWVLDEKRISIRNELQALRPLLILVVFAVGFRLFVGLFTHHLGMPGISAALG